MAKYLHFVQDHGLNPLDEDNNWWLFEEPVSAEEDTEGDEGDEGDEEEDGPMTEEPTTKRQKFNPFFDRDCELCSDQSSTQINKQCAYCIFCKSPMCSSCECTCPRAIRNIKGESCIISL